MTRKRQTNREISVVDIKQFAALSHELLKSDRDVTIGVSGFTGEGKSTFAVKLCQAYKDISNIPWNFDHLTWSRKELLEWIDGKGKARENQKPEYSALLPDELISMFYKRNWYEDGQKDAVELFNKCRDRHLLIIGNVPDFWDLDGGFITRIRFYVYIPKRGVAWVFQQENNPFITDKWNRTENNKIFRKTKTPYKCPNFLFEITFDDFEPKEKKEYYAIRNEKRRNTSNLSEKAERYKHVKKSRDAGFKLLMTNSRAARKLLKKVKDPEVKDFLEGITYTVVDLAELTHSSKTVVAAASSE